MPVSNLRQKRQTVGNVYVCTINVCGMFFSTCRKIGEYFPDGLLGNIELFCKKWHCRRINKNLFSNGKTYGYLHCHAMDRTYGIGFFGCIRQTRTRTGGRRTPRHLKRRWSTRLPACIDCAVAVVGNVQSATFMNVDSTSCNDKKKDDKMEYCELYK